MNLRLPHSNGPGSSFHRHVYMHFTELRGARYHEVHLASLSALLRGLQGHVDARLQEEAERAASAALGAQPRVFPSAHSSVARAVAAFAAGLRSYHATLVQSGRA